MQPRHGPGFVHQSLPLVFQRLSLHSLHQPLDLSIIIHKPLLFGLGNTRVQRAGRSPEDEVPSAGQFACSPHICTRRLETETMHIYMQHTTGIQVPVGRILASLSHPDEYTATCGFVIFFLSLNGISVGSFCLL